MFVIGVTGPMGSGKSSFVRFFAEKEQVIIDADELSHRLCEEDDLLKQELTALIGVEAYNDRGQFRRAYVAEKVFKDKMLLDQMTFKIHQAVVRKTKETLKTLEAEGTKCVILDFPLPIEEGFLDVSNHVVVLSSSENLRLERVQQRGLSLEQAKLRMALQMTQEEYNRLGHTLVENDGDLESLYQKWLNFVKTELWTRGILLHAQS